MPYTTDSTGRQVWSGASIPQASRESIRQELMALADRIAALEALLAAAPDDNENVYIGEPPPATLSGAIQNVFVGVDAGASLVSGVQNVGLGREALTLCTTGTSNVAVGESALDKCVDGNYTIGIGDSAGTRCVNNTVVSTPTNCIFIGFAAKSGSTSGITTNEIVIGYNASGNGDDSVTIGNSSTEYTYLKGMVSTTSAFKLPSYTVSTLPTAATYAQCIIYVSNGTSNKRLAVSDGTNWRWPDGTIVS